VQNANKVALIIGIDVYKDKNLYSLPFCKRDATDLSRLLSGLGYSIFRNEPIIGSKLDEELGSLQIRKSIIDFFLEAAVSDILLFYYSGYCIPWSDDVFLSNPQVDPRRPMIDGFSFSDLTKMIVTCRSKRIVSIIDACYSGSADLSKKTIKAKSAEVSSSHGRSSFDKTVQKISASEGRYFMLSSQPYSKSYSSQKLTNSIYTHYLIDGLRGNAADMNGNVTPESLHMYIYSKITEVSGYPPIFKAQAAGKIILTTYKEYPAKPKGDELLDLLYSGNVAEFNVKREKDRSITLNIGAGNLQRINLSGINLQGANLQGANLQGANLLGANLYMVTLQYANIQSTNLSGASLFEANLYEANLRKANLQGANLQGANLQGANLQGANLQGANLRFTSFDSAKLLGANLQGANLQGANLSNANFNNANLLGANLQDSNLRFTSFDSANLLGANLLGANLSNANFNNANLLGAIK
jgi:uncharacterized protein YjbI with pentapeptide repeats